MWRQRGFTIVELVVVLSIMAILLTLATIGLSTLQVNARDGERKADIEALARGLEIRYKQGNPRVTASPNNTAKAGGYPGLIEYFHIIGFGDQSGNGFSPGQIPDGYYTEGFPGTTAANFKAPGQEGNMGIYCFFCSSPPEDPARLATLVTINNYIYEPITVSGGNCNGEVCPRFNLYYRTEADGVLHTVRSEHQ